MEAHETLLKRCGQLLDMVRVAQKSVRVGVVFSLLTILGTTLLMVLETGEALAWIAMVLSGFGTFISYRGLAMIFSDSDRKQDLCIYLRSFRTDRESTTLRAWLKAALGSSFRLSGIRPPGERVSRLLSLLYPALTGIRYLGSSQFQLEAPDRNWMARLLATFKHTRFVFMDVRDVTPHVQDEIRLAWSMFGSARILFIVDDSRAAFAWRSIIMDLVGQPDGNPGSLHLLCWPAKTAPDKADFAATVRIFVAQLPQGDPALFPNVLSFVRNRVTEKSWASGLLEKETPLVIISILAPLAISFGLAYVPVGFIQSLAPWIGIFIALIFQVFAFIAWWNSRKQSRLNHQINPAQAAPKSRVWKALLCLMILPLISAVASAAAVAIPPIHNKAVQMKAANQARQLVMALKMYAGDNNGLYPDNEGATSSNDAFRHFFTEQIINDESVFGPANSGGFKPDGNIGAPPDYARALEPGENVWALTAGQSDTAVSVMPLIYTTPVRASWPPAWAPPTSRQTLGEAMPGNVIVLGLNNGSVSIVLLVPEPGTGLLVPKDTLSWTQYGEQKVLQARPR